MVFLAAVVLLACLLVGVALTVLGLPGNWLIVVAVAVYAALVRTDSAQAIGWIPVVIVLALAIVGEIVEFLAGAAGAAKAGASRRGVSLSLAGGLVGGMVGLFIGAPIPIIGSVIAAVLFGGVGALVGAMLGEGWKGRTLVHGWRIGKAAFRGRLLGTVVKTLVAVAMALVAGIALMV